MTQPTLPTPFPPQPVSTPPTPRLVTVNAVNWPNVFDFTHLFRGFRLAINPAKLMLALLAILLIYIAGRAFDFAWGPQVYQDELREYVSDRPEVFTALRARRLDSRVNALDRLLNLDDSLTPAQRDALKDSPRAAQRQLKSFYLKQFADDLKEAHDRRVTAEQVQSAAGPSPHTGAPSKTPADNEQDARAVASVRVGNKMLSLHNTVGTGIFDAFLHYETTQFDLLIDNTLALVRLAPISPAGSNNPNVDAVALSTGLVSRDADRLWRSDTVAGCLANMVITAPEWLFTATGPMQWRPDNADTWSGWIKMILYRCLYLATLTLLALFSIVLLAFTGASIARLSALELAGIERAPLKDVFFFALRRLWVFIKAPITPFLILLSVGILIAVGGLLGAIPYIGPIILGAVFFVFLGISFVLMLLVLGVLGGFNLLYPTIAVEGSDAFDAMSRSFAYVYARPWRVLFYTVTALFYGAITCLFVSFAVYVILLLTHTFVGWGANFFGMHYGAHSGIAQLETLWPTPQFLHLVQPINWYAMNWPEYLGAIMLHFWVFLLITGIGAYVISYYFSSHTIMYLLLRRSVDGQGIREVFMEEAAVTPAPVLPTQPPTM